MQNSGFEWGLMFLEIVLRSRCSRYICYLTRATPQNLKPPEPKVSRQSTFFRTVLSMTLAEMREIH